MGLEQGRLIRQRKHGWIGRKDRHPVELDAVVHRVDGSTVAVKLSNLSDEGCRLECECHFRIGERLQIMIPKIGNSNAHVRWSLPGSAGALFVTDLDF